MDPSKKTVGPHIKYGPIKSEGECKCPTLAFERKKINPQIKSYKIEILKNLNSMSVHQSNTKSLKRR